MNIYFVIIIAIIFVAAYLKHRKRYEQAGLYEKIGPLLTPAEQSFFRVLNSAIDGKWHIFAKVRVADVLKPKYIRDKAMWHRTFNKISRKHFDFVLCDPKTFTVFCIIELNDKSHDMPERRERDMFLSIASEIAGLPLVTFKVQATYNTREILSALPLATMPVISTDKICTVCSSLMVKRFVKKANATFWGCSSFPSCKHIEPILS